MQAKITSILAIAGLATAADKGWTGKLDIKTDAGLSGTVTVINDTAVMIKDYTLKSASAPALHWWGSTGEDISKGFRVNSMRVSEATPNPTDVTILLDSGKKASDFTYFGLWCESLKANFGEAKLQAASGASTSTGSGSMSSASSMPSASSKPSSKSGASLNRASTGAAVVAGGALLVASYLL